MSLVLSNQHIIDAICSVLNGMNYSKDGNKYEYSKDYHVLGKKYDKSVSFNIPFNGRVQMIPRVRLGAIQYSYRVTATKDQEKEIVKYVERITSAVNDSLGTELSVYRRELSDAKWRNRSWY